MSIIEKTESQIGSCHSFFSLERYDFTRMTSCRDNLLQEVRHLDFQCCRIDAWVTSQIVGFHQVIVNDQHDFMFIVIDKAHYGNRAGVDSQQFGHFAFVRE